jgi:hypothetical protein
VTRQISTKTHNAVASTPATAAACQDDRANRPGSVSDLTGEQRTPSQVDALRAAEASVQRGLIAGQVAR